MRVPKSSTSLPKWVKYPNGWQLVDPTQQLLGIVRKAPDGIHWQGVALKQYQILRSDTNDTAGEAMAFVERQHSVKLRRLTDDDDL